MAMLDTFAGKRINLFGIRVEDICIEDMAHSLALVNRFGGHTKFPISSAQHSYFVSLLCEPEHALYGLFHDAADAYVGDMTKWLKESPDMRLFRDLEDHVQRQCYAAVGIDLALTDALLPPDVHAADVLMVRYEALMGYGEHMPLFKRPEYPIPTAEEIKRIGLWKPWTWEHAEDMFLARYEELRMN